MANTSSTTIPNEVNNFYDRALLTRAVALFVHQLWAQFRDIPRKSGTKTVKFRRYANISAATTPLTAGITPAGSQLSSTELTATVAQYGDYVTITDELEFSSIDPVLTETADILGDQSGDTFDQLTRDVLAAGTSVTYAAGSSRGGLAAGNIPTTALLRTIVTTLENNKAMKVTEMVSPDAGYATTPVMPCYVAICSPATKKVLKGLAEYNPVSKYGRNAALFPGEFGTIDEIRLVATTNAKVFTGAGAGGIDVHATLILGKNAYGVTRITGESLKNIIKPLGSGGTTDPLNQRATSGWIGTFVAIILNDAFMNRFEHAVA